MVWQQQLTVPGLGLDALRRRKSGSLRQDKRAAHARAMGQASHHRSCKQRKGKGKSVRISKCFVAMRQHNETINRLPTLIKNM